MSFGSVAQSSKMPEVLKKKFLETFAQFPDITFLWKYEKDEDNIAFGYDNVITGYWLPLTDLLGKGPVGRRMSFYTRPTDSCWYGSVVKV